MNYIFIDSDKEKTKVGIVEDNRLVEFYSEEINNETLFGNVYRARVTNVLRGMDAAFVDIGEEKNAYLQLKDALHKDQMYTKEKYDLDEVIKSGEEVIVQVIKEPLGNKGPKVTTHISLPGRYLVLTPYSNKVNVSKKIRNNSEVNRLKNIGNQIIENDMGIIFRTLAVDVDENLLHEEYKSLMDVFLRIEKERSFLPTPKLLYKDLDLVYQIVRDKFNEKDTEIIVNNKEIYNNLLLLEDYFSYNLGDKILLNLDFSVDNDMKIQMDMKEALDRVVSLKSGGYIVIDETEALTAIDVNTGKYVGAYSLGDTVLRTNLEAAEEISRQIRLRDIGGIIIIDFIDMKEKNHISKVLSKLSESFIKDRNKPHIVDVTKLCLVEITRKKTRPTLDSKISTICPTCNGRGRVRINKY
ncbi:Rne/Rng family ribonuclease [Tissierella sp. Yu-01]|uniref:Rne/Rng family ribonuclease n=1 Tax=Tissierella sp. Yu-01 TaxID=3035694 RepID=UPI00240D6843|nr:Rne/Rng family ribonuclease [Tissierella sp. Yu-01]WFA09497.1 Rne/Rng family ribonuclease [Tissierella sp. Yu-01]